MTVGCSSSSGGSWSFFGDDGRFGDNGYCGGGPDGCNRHSVSGRGLNGIITIVVFLVVVGQGRVGGCPSLGRFLSCNHSRKTTIRGLSRDREDSRVVED